MTTDDAGPDDDDTTIVRYCPNGCQVLDELDDMGIPSRSYPALLDRDGRCPVCGEEPTP